MGEVVMISEEMMVDTEVEDLKTKNDGSAEVVRWENLLPSMALRVLLVEADDSTRQIITALLRKCNYRVAAVPDGLTAWETLKGRPHSIDLILTEVELPSISGYALLTLVMEHDICKNIPVIMMSSNDSISMVLKCMLKGAADFLIKPIRRNELRNLWQHVWRRQTLTSGHTHQNFHKVEGTSENDAASKGTSENDAASNHSSDCATSTQKNRESSGKGSETQSSCTNPYLEAESVGMQNMQGLSQLNYKSTSNQTDRGGSKYEECLELDVKSVTQESKIREGSNSLEPEGMPCTGTHYPTALRLREDHNCPKSPFQDASVRPDTDMAHANISLDHCNVVEPSNGAIDLIGTFDNGPKETHGNSSLNEKFEFSTQLELSLKRFCSSSSKYQGVDERHALNHSNASAFSWYNNKTLQSFCPMSTANSTEFIEASKSPELSSNQKSQNICGISERHGGQEAMTSLAIGQYGKTELVYPRPQHGRIPMLGVRHDNTSCGHVFSPIYTQSDTPSAWNPKLASRREQSLIPTHASVHSNPEIYESENNYRHSDETANTSTGQNAHRQENTEMVEEPTLGSPTGGQSTGSSFCNGNVNHNNGSACGSFCSTSDGNAKSVAAAERATVTESLNDSGSYGFRGMDPHRSIQREAALTKFRLKRKDRCYEKKVRYQSRKRLAEQRPRVKGQFVRQVQIVVPMADANA